MTLFYIILGKWILVVSILTKSLAPHFIVLQIWVPSNPKGAESLPPGIVEAESDFYLRRLWGKPSEVCILQQFIGLIWL
jgi:hypothetical protein